MKSKPSIRAGKPSFASVLVALAVLGIVGLCSLAAWRGYTSTYLVFPTRFGKCRIYQVADDADNPVRLLEVNGIVQSGTYIDDRYTDLVFEYLKMYDLMFEAERPIRNVCVLGCGGYDYPEHLIAHHPEVSVDAIEIDPAITALARRYFFLDRLIEEYDTERSERLNLIEADAFDFLSNSNDTYDAIVNDTFDGGTPPAHLCTREFLKLVHEHLAPQGIYLTNIVAALSGKNSDFLVQQMALMNLEFKYVYLFPCDETDLESADNIIVVATDSALPQTLCARSL